MNTEAGQILDKTAAPIPEPQATEPGTDATTAPAVQVKEDRVSPKLEILIKREREAVQREKLARERETAAEEKWRKAQEFEALRSDPLKAIQALGFTPEDFAKIQVNDGQIPADVQIKKLQEEIENLRKDRAQDKSELQLAEERKQKEEHERVIASFNKDINDYIDEHKTRYEFIDFEGQRDLVYAVIDEHFKRTTDPETGAGQIMSIQEACDKVEQHLEDKYNRATKLNKTQTLWSAIPKAQQKELAKPEQKPQTPPPKTLTNQLSATPTKPSTTLMSDDERVRKAIAYAQQNFGVR